jgi:membrane protein
VARCLGRRRLYGGPFSLGKYAIGLYLRHSGVASSFGAAGWAIALLLWVYYPSVM